MNAAARELGLLAAAKAREPVFALARIMRRDCGLPPSDALKPELVLTASDRA